MKEAIQAKLDKGEGGTLDEIETVEVGVEYLWSQKHQRYEDQTCLKVYYDLELLACPRLLTAEEIEQLGEDVDRVLEAIRI